MNNCEVATRVFIVKPKKLPVSSGRQSRPLELTGAFSYTVHRSLAMEVTAFGE
jgi:hypothetical protein